MKQFLVAICTIGSVALWGQESPANVCRGGTTPRSGVINLSDPSLQDWAPQVVNISEQQDGLKAFGEGKQTVNQLRKQREAQHLPQQGGEPRGSVAPPPVMLTNFTANNAQGTPNDNHVAISNNGKLVSVANTNFRVYNETGTQLQAKTLSLFANSIGILLAISDPRVIYDPVADRFVVVFFSGNTSQTTQIIIGFSQTNDPAQQWNLYALSGNYLNDSTWSDYPIISLSDNDLFMTFNHLQDGYDWKSGFRYSAIWQIDKQHGYAGDSLQFNFWHHVDFNGQPVWNVCPVRGGLGLSGNNTYFLSVRPGDLSNDTVFLHTISGSSQSGSAQLSTKVFTTGLSYGIAPDARQRDGQYLATNDARVLDAFVANDKIQYVQNTVTPSLTAGVYVGEIDHPEDALPTATGQLISNDTVDFGYASIAYMGNNAFDNRAIITCSYSSPDTFPGTVAFYKDASGVLSDMLVVKKGERAVDVLLDSVERWGDYTGIQRKYNEPNVAWLAGSYGYPSQTYRTWIARVVNPDSSVVSSVLSPQVSHTVQVFPNPASEMVSVRFEAEQRGLTTFTLYDVNGKRIRDLLQDNVEEGINNFSFNTQYLAEGVYFLRISQKGVGERTEKMIIKRQ